MRNLESDFMTKLVKLAATIDQTLSSLLTSAVIAANELTIECDTGQLLDLLQQLKTNEDLAFDQLIDVCGVDYLLYGKYDWQTDSACDSGFSRGVEQQEYEQADTVDDHVSNTRPRFAVVYHLLSTSLNHRLRVRVYLNENYLVIPSVHQLWKGADWFEREAYDLYGILFTNHPDLRRILTDYGFIGHPFRKDFPVSGTVEMRYDAARKQVIYEPVDIEPRVLVPKVIRDDNRYMTKSEN